MEVKIEQPQIETPLSMTTRRAHPQAAAGIAGIELQALANVIQRRSTRLLLWRVMAGAKLSVLNPQESVEGGRGHARALSPAVPWIDGVLGRRAAVRAAGDGKTLFTSRGDTDEDDVLQHFCVFYRFQVPRRFREVGKALFDLAVLSSRQCSYDRIDSIMWLLAAVGAARGRT